VALSGVGRGPIAVGPSPLYFGSQAIGTGYKQTVTVLNTGNAPLTVTNTAIVSATASDNTSSDYAVVTSTTPSDCTNSTPIAPNTSCSITIAFTPTASGPRSATLRIYNSTTDSPQTVALSGSGHAPAPSASLPSTYSFGSQAIGQTRTQYIYLNNVGEAPLVISSTTIISPSAGDTAPGDYRVVTGTNSYDCASGSAIAAHGYCYLGVAFTPSALGARTAHLQLTDNAANSPQTMALTGTGTTPVPAIFVSPNPLDFGSQAVGYTSTARSLYVNNSGTAPLIISSTTILSATAGDNAPADFQVVPNTNQSSTDRYCSTSSPLAAGDYCYIYFTFSPSTLGVRKATLQINDNALNSRQTISLTGTGTSPTPAVSLYPILSFDTQMIGYTSTAQTVYVNNYGTAPLTISSTAILSATSGDNAVADFQVVTPTNTSPNNRYCSTTSPVAVGDYCYMNLTFTPSALGVRRATLQMTDNASGSPQTVALTGTGTIPAPMASIYQSTLSFGYQSVGYTSTVHSLSINNTGHQSLAINGIDVVASGDDNAATDYTVITGTALSNYYKPCATRLTPGDYCSVYLTFAPSALGARTAHLRITDNAADSPQTVALTGTGTGPSPAINVTAWYGFGDQPISTTSHVRSLYVGNNTGAAQPLVISNTTILSATAGDNAVADFQVVTGTNGSAYSDACAPSRPVAAGNYCYIYFTFTPTALGSRQAALRLFDNMYNPATGRNDGSQDISLYGNGVTASTNITPSGLTFAAQAVGTTSATQTVTFTNVSANSLYFNYVQLNDSANSNGAGGGLSANSRLARVAATSQPDLSRPFYTFANSTQFSAADTCPYYGYLAAGASCTVGVTFHPTSRGQRLATLTFNDDAAGAPQTVPLTGTGSGAFVGLAGPGISFDASTNAYSLTFPDQQPGASASQVITVTNIGNAALTFSSSPISVTGTGAASFAESDTCAGQSLNAGQSCLVTVDFASATNGTYKASLQVVDNAPNSPQNVSVTARSLFTAVSRPVWSWGDNDNGQLGDGTYNNSFTPIQARGITGIVALASGSDGSHSLALAKDGAVYAWGYNGNGQLGLNDYANRTTPARVVSPFDVNRPMTGVVALAAGSYHSLALTGDGHVYAWGYNGHGQLGDGTTNQYTYPVTVTVASGDPISNVVAIAVGGFHSLAVTRDGRAYSWGANYYGQLGGNDYNWRYRAAPVVSPFDVNQPMTNVAALAAGSNFSLFLSKSGRAYAAGDNGAGQLGDGTNNQYTYPMTVTTLGSVNVVSLAAGAAHSVALAKNGTVYSWGTNGYGQLGSGDTGNSAVALQVPDLTGVTSISAGGSHSLALTRDGRVHAWGDNEYGQIGARAYNLAACGYSYRCVTPITVAGLDSVVAIAAGRYHSLALTGFITPTTSSAQAQMSADALAFGQQLVGTSGATRAVTITNTGSATLTVTNVTLDNTTDFSVTVDGCGATTLTAGASCAIRVAFTPSTTGPRTGALTVRDTVDGAAQTVSVSGVGVTPMASLDSSRPITASSLTFGDQPLNTAGYAQSVYLYNLGHAPLTVGSIVVDGANSGDFTASSSCMIVAPGSYCSIGVTFTPSFTGTRTATLTISDNGSNSTRQTVTLTGNGINPVPTFTPASLDFGAQLPYTAVTRTIALTNTGTTPLYIQYLSLSYSYGDTFGQTTNCPTYGNLAVGASCAITVTFSPRSTGQTLASVALYDNAAHSPQTIALTGTGAGPVVQVSGDGLNGATPNYNLDFGAAPVGSPATRTITMTNGGNAPLVLDATPITIAGASDYGESDSCAGASVAPGQNCHIVITFAPTLNTQRTATMRISDNGGDSPRTISLTGRGYFPAAMRPVYGWGYGGYGQLDTGDTGDVYTPTSTRGISGVVGLAAGDNHSLVVAHDGTVYAWGANNSGQLDIGATASYSVPVHVVVPVDPTDPTITAPLTNVTAVAAGSDYSLALLKDGTVYSWGNNGYGQLGYNTAVDTNPTPQQIPNPDFPTQPLTNVAAIAAGRNFAFALLKNGTVYAWGDNERYQLGTGNAACSYHCFRLAHVVSPFDSSRPMTDVVGVAAGQYHALFLTSDGTVYGAGDNSNGQVGDDTTTNSTTPVTATSLSGVTIKAVAAGGIVTNYYSNTNSGYSLALAQDGTVYAWGDNGYGQLGTGNTRGSRVALQIPGLTGVASIAASGNHGMALLRDGTVRTWGDNYHGELGANYYCSYSYSCLSTTPVSVTGLMSVTAIAAGGAHDLALVGASAPANGSGGVAGLSADALAFGQQQVGTRSVTQTITVRNTTTAPLTVTSVSLVTDTVDFTITANTCADVGGQLVQQGATCTIGVVFTPLNRGAHGGALRIADTADAVARIVSLGGVGTAPTAGPNTATYYFGNQSVGITSTQNLYVSNNGNAPLTVTDARVVSAAADDNAPSDFTVITGTYSYNSCFNGPIAPGSGCNVYVAFTPSAILTRTATLRLFDDAPNSPQTVRLTGNGINPGASVSPTRLTFGHALVYGTSSPLTITIANTGTTPLIFGYNPLSISNSDEFREISRTCPSYYGNLAPGASCTISIAFAPSALGTRSGALSVYDNALGSPQTVSLTGTGAGPIASINSPGLTSYRPFYGLYSLDFGTTTTLTPASRVITLTNTGDYTLTLTSPIAISGTNAGDVGESDTCGTEISVGRSCAITVTFLPQSNGARSATLTFVDNAGDSPQTIALTGRGLYPTASNPMYAWGNDGNGQLGTDASTYNCYYYCAPSAKTPVQVNAISNSLSFAAGREFSLAVAPDHTAYAWGYNGYGQLGTNDYANHTTPVHVVSPFDVNQPMTDVVVVASGFYHALALTSDGHVYAWGRNSEGQLGTGDTTQHAYPVTVTVASGDPISNVVSIAANGYHSLAVTRDGHVYAWGDNDNGQLGVASYDRRDRAVPVVSPFDANGPVQSATATAIATATAVTGSVGANRPMTGVLAVAAGNNFSLFLSRAGTVYASGDNSSGQLGDGTTNGSSYPITATSLGRVAIKAIAAGQDGNSMALARDGTVYTWGLGDYGQLGNGFTPTRSTTARQVGGLTGVTAIAAGGLHDLALTRDGHVHAWGYNSNGQLGVGSYSYNSSVPTTVTGLVSATAIAAGYDFSLALTGVSAQIGGTGQVSITPDALPFGQQKVGTRGASQTVTIMNTADAPVTVTGVTLVTDTVDFTITANTCAGAGGQLATQGALCTIDVAFIPTARGVTVGALRIDDSLDSAPRFVSLGGGGTTPVVSAAPTGLSFDQRQVNTTSDMRYVYVYNNGDAPLTVSGVSITGTNRDDFSYTSSCSTVQPGSNNGSYCAIGVTFRPAGILTRTATLRIDDDGANSTTQTVALTGTGVNPGVAFSPAGLDFGRQQTNTSSDPLTVTVTNTGTTPLSIYNIYTGGANGYEFNPGGACIRAIDPGASCAIGVTFRPTDTGRRFGALYVYDNAGNGSVQAAAALTGTGTTAADLAVSAIAAPNPVPVGDTLTYTLTAVNNGPTAATNSALTDTLPDGVTVAAAAAPGGCSVTGVTVICNLGRLTTSGAGHSAMATIVVTPTTAGLITNTVTVSADQIDPDASNNTVTTTVRAGSPVAIVNPPALNVGPQRVGASATRAITVSNTGTTDLQVGSITIDGAQSDDFAALDPNGCATASIAAGASCIFSVRFVPGATGARAATLRIADNSQARPSVQTVPLTGTGTAPGATLSPVSIDFGSIALGASLTRTVTISNPGTAALDISSIYVDGAQAGDFVVSDPNGCSGAGVAAGARCAIVVQFAPGAGGERAGTLHVVDDAGAQPSASQTMTLTGVGLPPRAMIQPDSLDFGQVAVGSSLTRTVTASNTGAGILHIASMSIDGAQPGDFQASDPNGCAGGIAAGTGCVVVVRFAPGAHGARAATLHIVDDAGGQAGAEQTVALTGTGTTPVVALVPDALDFGRVARGASVTRTVTISNSGDAALSIGSLTVDAGDYGVSDPNGCATNGVAAGASCAVAVTFTPRDIGTRAGTFYVADNAANGQQAVALTGTSVAPRVVVNPSSLTFSTLVVGTSATATVTVTNTGNDNLSIYAPTLDDTADYGVVDASAPCSGTTLAPGASCALAVTFAPHNTGALNATLTISTSDTAPQVPLYGTGKTPPGPPSVRGVTTNRNDATSPSYYAPGSPVVISATVLDSYGDPAADAVVTASIFAPGATTPVTLSLANGGAGDVYSATLPGGQTGTQGVYNISVLASRPGVGETLDPAYGSFVVTTRTVSLAGAITVPSHVHQGDVITVQGCGVYNGAYVADAATVAVSVAGNALSATQTVRGIPAHGTSCFNLALDTAALDVGAHMLRIELKDLPPDQDPRATTVQTAQVTVDEPLPSMAVTPNPLSILVAAGDGDGDERRGVGLPARYHADLLDRPRRLGRADHPVALIGRHEPAGSRARRPFRRYRDGAPV